MENLRKFMLSLRPETNAESNASYLDHPDAGLLQHLHDFCLVRAPQTAGNEDFDLVAADLCHPVFVGHRLL